VEITEPSELKSRIDNFLKKLFLMSKKREGSDWERISRMKITNQL
jgi:hypothetical protein